MSLITIAELKTHVETDLSDAALQRVIDGQERAIFGKYGDHDSASEVFEETFSKVIFPGRKVSAITSITERVGDTDTVLSSDDYEVITGGGRIDRLGTGTNPATYWGDRVTVVYTPVDTSALRIQVLIDLCILTLAFNGLKRESTGDYSSEAKEYNKERRELLSTLQGRSYA